MGGKDRLPLARDAPSDRDAALVARARAAQAAFDAATQDEVDEVVTAAGWAIVDPEHNRALAELAVRDTGLGNVGDKMAKNRRKTIGLLRDLAGSKSVGVIAEDSVKGLVEIARPVGVRRRDHAVDQPGGDAGEQHHQRAEGTQRHHRRAFAEGRIDAARCCSPTCTPSWIGSACRATWCNSCPRR